MPSKTKKNKTSSTKQRHTLDLQYLTTDRGENTSIITPYVVAIPSYKRPELIARATLWVLFKGRVPANHITIFLANTNERHSYATMLQDPIESDGRIKAVLPKNIPDTLVAKYTKWLQGVTLVIGHKGLAKQRNFITSWYPSGQHILNMDDDVRQVMQLRVSKNMPQNRKKWYLAPVTGLALDNLIQSAFHKARATNAHLWGVYPVDNAYFMQPNSSSGLKFIVGPMFGIINRPELSNELDITMDEKEDMERTLRYWMQDGTILRLNYVTIQTAYYDNMGGMQASIDTPLEARKIASEESAKRIHNMFPDLTRIYHRKGGPREEWAEIRLLGDRPLKRTQKNPSSGVGYSSQYVKNKRTAL